MLKEVFNLIRRIESRVYPIPQKPVGKVSYSQCAEDILIEYIFNLRGIQKPTYLDIGAHHPWFLSNTAYFYQKGCRGINIEPNPQLIKAFKIERKEDINLNIGIAGITATLDFYVLSDSTLSTFSKQEADEQILHGRKLESIQQIPVDTISRVLKQHTNGIFTDFLTIDVEGLEFEILNEIDYINNYPKVICIESAEYSPIGAGKKRTDLICFIESKGYYLYADTNLNSIFVKNEFWFI